MFRKIVKFIFILSLFLSSVIFTSISVLGNRVDENYKISKGEILNIESFVPVTAHYNGVKMSQKSLNATVGESFDVDLKIFGVIPFSTVNVQVVDELYVAVLGNPFGMKVYTEGVHVIETAEVQTDGGNVYPAKLADIKQGDYIKTVNGKQITCNEDLSALVADSNGETLDFEIVRDNKTIITKVTPVADSQSGVYRIGIWVRDSSAGIGTLTFYSPSTNVICGLGHGICDSDTGTLLAVKNGELVEASIVSVEKGSAGNPGALKGKFTYESIADISINSNNGVYGVSQKNINTSNLTEIALKQEIYDGNAQILCTVDGESPKLYSCTIKKSASNYHSDTQNLVVTVTDKQLIKATGGIVQGMSGSPVIQNGKLVGAVTHVLVDDPTKGYAIFAENMLETAQSVAEEQKLKEAS